ncbi:hypothetical protein CYMTET_21109, partial [Cymbomonas tetramitiformis]
RRALKDFKHLGRGCQAAKPCPYKRPVTPADTSRLSAEDWLLMMHDANLIKVSEETVVQKKIFTAVYGPNQISSRKLLLNFSLSRLLTVEDDRSFGRIHTHAFLTFLEALARASTEYLFPPIHVLRKAGFKGPYPTYEYHNICITKPKAREPMPEAAQDIAQLEAVDRAWGEEGEAPPDEREFHDHLMQFLEVLGMQHYSKDRKWGIPLPAVPRIKVPETAVPPSSRVSPPRSPSPSAGPQGTPPGLGPQPPSEARTTSSRQSKSPRTKSPSNGSAIPSGSRDSTRRMTVFDQAKFLNSVDEADDISP